MDRFEESKEVFNKLVGELPDSSKEIDHVDGEAKSYEFEDAITADGESSKTVYYYVVVEFVNNETSENLTAQNSSMNAVLNGNITVVPA